MEHFLLCAVAHSWEQTLLLSSLQLLPLSRPPAPGGTAPLPAGCSFTFRPLKESLDAFVLSLHLALFSLLGGPLSEMILFVSVFNCLLSDCNQKTRFLVRLSTLSA